MKHKPVMAIILILAAAGAITWLAVERAGARLAAESKACGNNLGMIWSAKRAWAQDMRAATNATPKMEDIMPYVIGREPKCPAGGTYTIGRVADDPTCNHRGHVLPPHTTP